MKLKEFQVLLNKEADRTLLHSSLYDCSPLKLLRVNYRFLLFQRSTSICLIVSNYILSSLYLVLNILHIFTFNFFLSTFTCKFMEWLLKRPVWYRWQFDIDRIIKQLQGWMRKGSICFCMQSHLDPFCSQPIKYCSIVTFKLTQVCPRALPITMDICTPCFRLS